MSQAKRTKRSVFRLSHLQRLGRRAHAAGVEVGHAHRLAQPLLPAVSQALDIGIVAEVVGACTQKRREFVTHRPM